MIAKVDKKITWDGKNTDIVVAFVKNWLSGRFVQDKWSEGYEISSQFLNEKTLVIVAKKDNERRWIGVPLGATVSRNYRPTGFFSQERWIAVENLQLSAN